MLEGRFVWLAARALRLGVSVILDFGLWGKDERSALRWFAGEAGASYALVYLAVSEAEQRRRVEARVVAEPKSTFEMSYTDLDRYRRLFQVPDQAEFASSQIDAASTGYTTWSSWVSERWPSSIS